MKKEVEDKEPEVNPRLEAIKQSIEKWKVEYLHNSPMSRDTEAYNHLMAQLPMLATIIDEEVL